MALYEASFKVKHECPYRTVSERFPSLTLREWALADCQILEVSSAGPVDEEVGDALRGIGTILHEEQVDGRLHVVLKSCQCSLEDSLVQHLEEHNCLYVPPTVYRQGWEHYTAVAFSQDDINAMLRELMESGEVEVASKKKLKQRSAIRDALVPVERLFDGVTTKQLDALQVALDGGFYKEPREASTRKLAERTPVSRSTYEEHLRKAENRLMRNIGRYVRMVTYDSNSKPTRAVKKASPRD